MQFLERTTRLLGEENMHILKEKHIAIFGCGGVGGYVTEMLARTGIGTMTLIDFDVVDITNINRQIIALHSTIGKKKVDVLKARILDINPECNVICKDQRFTISSAEELLLSQYDMVVDAIDIVKDKCYLIHKCHEKNIPCISAMGAGRRMDIPSFEVMDIAKTTNDGLAKVVRKKLKEYGMMHHTVVATKSLPIDTGTEIGSIAYYPAMCGCVIASYVIQQLIAVKEQNKNIIKSEEKL